METVLEKSDNLVMVVDDEPTICSIVERILTEAGYKVIIANDGMTALNLFDKHYPDLILLDIMMPGINGNEVCHRIREVSETTRIVYLTAKAVSADSLEYKGYRNESDAFIAKPVTGKKILSTVRRVLRRKRR